MERLKAEAVVLSSVDYGDTDRIVTLLTRSKGRVTAFAAGARKSKRRFAGALEPGTYLNVQLVERRGDTFRLDGADIRETFHSLRDDLARISRALYCLELTRELCRDHEPHPELFDHLLRYLELLSKAAAGPTSLIKFELDALEVAGFRPRFSSCTLCGGELEAPAKFDPSAGGVSCPHCAARVPHGLPISLEVVQALYALQNGSKQPMNASTRSRSRELLNLFIAHHLGRRLKSVDFMSQVGLD
ncbi:MAG: DNA repair protein RecO [Myxococcaceae bacterium]|nr:DNA repair protein RecO [Myxococcaceae bacterium]